MNTDYDPEDVQFAARTDDGDVVIYLPKITYLDTQPWSVEIGLTPERLVQLRDALDNHLRGAGGTANRVDIDTTGPDGGAACPPVMGERPTTVVQQTTVASSSEGAANDRGSSGTSVATQTEATVTETVTVPLRERLRAALRHHIDPDDDTMPALCRDGFLWVPADDVLDNLVRALDSPDPIEFIARVSAAADTPSGPPDQPTSEYGIGWDTAMNLVRAAIKEQP